MQRIYESTSLSFLFFSSLFPPFISCRKGEGKSGRASDIPLVLVGVGERLHRCLGSCALGSGGNGDVQSSRLVPSRGEQILLQPSRHLHPDPGNAHLRCARCGFVSLFWRGSGGFVRCYFGLAPCFRFCCLSPSMRIQCWLMEWWS